MNQEFAYGMWAIAAFNIGLFLFIFLSFLPPKDRLEWRNFGMVTAFLVALFVEMYGFPLTIYVLTGWLGEAYPVLQPFSRKYGHFWVVVFGGSDMAWGLVIGASLALMVAGYILLSKGCRQVHGSHGQLITNGVYSFARHPQYTGLFLVIFGFLVQWPTLLTVLMAPVLLFAYAHLARSEERVMRQRFGQQYMDYRLHVPAFFPSLDRWKAFLTATTAEQIET